MVSANCSCRRLERKRKECRNDQKQKRHDVVPGELFLEKRSRKGNEYHEGHGFLNKLELKPREFPKANSIGRHRKTVLDQRDAPRYEDRL